MIRMQLASTRYLLLLAHFFLLPSVVDSLAAKSAQKCMKIRFTSRDGVPRRSALTCIFVSLLSSIQAKTSPAAVAAETVGKDPDCIDRTCLGIWDGLLADCPHGRNGSAGCTSSQDDTPGIFSEPWDYSEATTIGAPLDDWKTEIDKLIMAIQSVSSRRGDSVRIDLQEGRYLRVFVTDGRSGEESVGEFYFTPNDTTVQFRVAALPPSPGVSSSGGHALLTLPLSSSVRNQERCEVIRRELGYLKLPVLRNRRRSLFFLESDLDTFGPGYSDALGPPAEMKTGELNGRQDVDPRRKIDILQGFPVAANN